MNIRNGLIWVLWGCSLGMGAPSLVPEDPEITPEKQLRLDVQHDILPKLSLSLLAIDSNHASVARYGALLKAYRGDDVDDLSIHNDNYWKAFLETADHDPRIYWARASLLCYQGLLQRAAYVMNFVSQEDTGSEHSLLEAIRSMQERYSTIEFRSNEQVDQGLNAYDAGLSVKAKSYYQSAIDMYPKNPWANYELAMLFFVDDLGKLIDSSAYAKTKSQRLLVQVRLYDPFYISAYQGPGTALSSQMTIVRDKIQPVLKSVMGRKKDMDDLLQFAQGCAAIGEYEFAIYAYHWVLNQPLDDARAQQIRAKMVDCLRSLGAVGAAEMVSQRKAAPLF